LLRESARPQQPVGAAACDLAFGTNFRYQVHADGLVERHSLEELVLAAEDR